VPIENSTEGTVNNTLDMWFPVEIELFREADVKKYKGRM
jgi:prephenate dehydratase